LDSRKPSRKPSLRLQKYLADCGFGSRRACEKLIADACVTVDGQVVAEQGSKVDPERQDVRVRGVAAKPQTKVYLALNKPRGYLCTSRDPQGRPTFHKLLPKLPERVYTVGRLDYDSEGLIIVTNDGELSNRLTHPSHEISKIYTVTASRRIRDEEMRRLQKGMSLQGEHMWIDSIQLVRSNAKGSIYRVTLSQGRNRQIRRMFKALGVNVTRLRRIQVGPLQLGDLKVGEWRPLTPSEIDDLYRSINTRLR
jgi:23S rRNA pseudouridine2605 synthase